jgi:lipopolysaccharide transport system permease protein
MEIKTTIYEANQRSKTGFLKTLLVISQNIYDSWDLIYQLYRRDFLMNYKKSFLGFGWLLFAPIMGILSWVFMNIAGVITPGDVGVPYPVYVLLSTSIWGLFMSFYTNSGQSLQVAQGFIQQVNFHHEALLVKQGLQDITNFGITLIINIILMLLMGVIPHWQIVLLPIMVIPIFFIAASMGLMVSIITTVTTDILRIATFMLTLFMFVTPVIYSAKLKIPWLQHIIYYNPLTYLVCGPRDLILYGKINHMENYWYALTLAIVMFTVALRFFYVSEKKVIEKML